ncbi:hypothetical protein GCM10020254_40150 [Streptomyces goshikiensis]
MAPRSHLRVCPALGNVLLDLSANELPHGVALLLLAMVSGVNWYSSSGTPRLSYSMSGTADTLDPRSGAAVGMEDLDRLTRRF